LTAFTVGEDGSLSDRRIFADGLDGPPDGIALDADGGVWASMTMAHQFQRFLEGGMVTDGIDMGDRTAIACTLGGSERRRSAQ
jgi:sugar lactone lactonase YvrE